MVITTVSRISGDEERGRVSVACVRTLASVVVVSYNSRKDLPRCLDSLLRTNYPSAKSEIRNWY